MYLSENNYLRTVQFYLFPAFRRRRCWNHWSAGSGAGAGQSASGSVAIVTSLVQALLTLALREQGNQPDTPPGLLKLLGHSRLAISVCGSESLNILDNCRTGAPAAMSRATYARHFAESAGMGVGAFLLRLRMLGRRVRY